MRRTAIDLSNYLARIVATADFKASRVIFFPANRFRLLDERRETLDRIEERENRAAETALHREEFQRVAELVRKSPGRELKPQFNRAAEQQIERRTGTQDGRAPVPRQPEEQQPPKSEKGRFS